MGLLEFLGCDDKSQIEAANAREAQREYWLKTHGRKPSYGPTPSSGNGGATKIALTNMLSTSDLDQLLADCAPALTNTVYKMAAQADFLQKQMMEAKEYDELKGRYTELQERYDELKKEYNTLIESLAKSAGKDDVKR